MWQRIRSLIVKELLAVLRDPRGALHPHRAADHPDARLLRRGHAGGEERADGGPERRLRHGRARPDRAVRGLDQLRPGPLPPRRGRHRPGHRLAERAHGRAPRPGFLAAARRRNAGRGPAHPRRPALERGPDRRRLCPGHLRRLRPRARRHAPHPAAAERRGRAGLVQPQPRNHLEHGARPGGDPHNPDGPGRDGALRGPRTRARHVRAASGLAARPASRS